MRNSSLALFAIALTACILVSGFAYGEEEAPALSCNADLSLPPELTGPAQTPLSGCSAEKTDCYGGGTVSCTGWDVCQVEYNGVRCDGVLTPCACNAPPACTGGNEQAYCDCRNAGGSHFVCVCNWCIGGCP